MKEEDYITGNKLKELLLLKGGTQGNRTLKTYIERKLIPQPKEKRNKDLLFSKEVILEALGITDFNEPFIDIEDVSKILGRNIQAITSACKVGNLPHYRLSKNKGSKIYFRESELRAVQEVILESQSMNHFLRTNLLKSLFLKIFDLNNQGIDSDHLEVIKEVLIYGWSRDESALKRDLSTERIRQIITLSLKQLFINVKESPEKLKLNKKVVELEEDVKVLEIRKATLIKELIQESEVKEIPVAENRKVKELNFSVRALGWMKDNKIEYVFQLLKYTKHQISRYRNMGRKTINDIDLELKIIGLSLKEI